MTKHNQAEANIVRQQAFFVPRQFSDCKTFLSKQSLHWISFSWYWIFIRWIFLNNAMISKLFVDQNDFSDLDDVSWSWALHTGNARCLSWTDWFVSEDCPWWSQPLSGCRPAFCWISLDNCPAPAELRKWNGSASFYDFHRTKWSFL